MQSFIDVGAVLLMLGMVGSVLAGYLFNRENGQPFPDWPSVIALASLSGFLILTGLVAMIGGYRARIAAVSHP
jgi:hypothetical protein